LNGFAGEDTYAYTVLIQPDGTILIAGSSDDYFALARYYTDGSPDSTFGNNGKVLTEIENEAYILDLALQDDNKIVALGYYESFVGSDSKMAVARYNPDGTPDTGFGDNGVVTTNVFNEYGTPHGLLIQPDQKILIASRWKNGFDDSYSYYFARFTTSGEFDNSFGNDGELLIDPNGLENNPQAMLYQGDNKIVVAGWCSTGIWESYSMIRMIIEPDTTITTIEGPQSYSIDLTFSSNTLQVTDPLSIPYSLCLYNMRGNLIAVREENKNLQLGLNDLAPGVYLAVSVTRNGRLVKKIVVQ